MLRAQEADPIPAAIFADHASYLRDCAAVERLLQIQGGTTLARPATLQAGYDIRLPRLMTGTSDQPDTGLTAMQSAFRGQSGVTRLAHRAQLLRRAGGNWHIRLDTGEEIKTRRIVLAAGVVGTARLLMASFPEITAARFQDHTPYMLYCAGLSHLRRLRPKDALRHFNALTIEKTENSRTALFASLYDMGRAELNLVLASSIGRTFSFLRGWPSPPVGWLIQLVQVWTPDSFGWVEIDAGSGAATTGQVPGEHDAALDEIKASVTELGGRVLHASRTRPGDGFHYHMLRLARGGAFADVGDVLRDITGDGVLCVDASVLPEIGLRPHTLTSMAVARRLILNHA